MQRGRMRLIHLKKKCFTPCSELSLVRRCLQPSLCLRSIQILLPHCVCFLPGFPPRCCHRRFYRRRLFPRVRRLRGYKPHGCFSFDFFDHGGCSCVARSRNLATRLFRSVERRRLFSFLLRESRLQRPRLFRCSRSSSLDSRLLVLHSSGRSFCRVDTLCCFMLLIAFCQLLRQPSCCRRLCRRMLLFDSLEFARQHICRFAGHCDPRGAVL